jgi:hypothetical protein
MSKMTNETVANAEKRDGWQRCDFASPVRLIPQDSYLAMLRVESFIYTLDFWSAYGLDSGVLVGVHSRVYNYVGAVPFSFPTYVTTTTYWVDIIFKQDTLSLPTELVRRSTEMTTTPPAIIPVTSAPPSTLVGSSMGLTVSSSTASGSDLLLIGVLIGVALFIQCIVLFAAIILFVKWKRLRLSTSVEAALDSLTPVYADASEVRQSPIV